MSKSVTIGNKKATITPFASWMTVFVLIPMALVVYYAFTTDSGTFTLENLKWIYTYRSTMFLSFIRSKSSLVYQCNLSFKFYHLLSLITTAKPCF